MQARAQQVSAAVQRTGEPQPEAPDQAALQQAAAPPAVAPQAATLRAVVLQEALPAMPQVAPLKAARVEP
jgi:hypothetical protein